jgi:ferredoxin
VTTPALASSTSAPEERRRAPASLPEAPAQPRPSVNGKADPASRLRALRTFHLTGVRHQDALPQDLLPALLHPFRDFARVRFDYPLVVSPKADGGLEARPLAEALLLWLDEVAPGGGARILRDNLTRLERDVREAMAAHASPPAAKALLEAQGGKLGAQLGLRAEHADALETDLRALWGRVPEASVLVGYGPRAGLQLFALGAQATLSARRASYAQKARGLLQKIERIIKVERTKDPEAHRAQALEASMPAAGLQLDTTALARLLGGHRGTEAIAPERRRRLEAAHRVLLTYLSGGATLPSLVVLCAEPGPTLAGVRAVTAADPCAEAAAEFDRTASELAQVFRAARLAQLELDGAYDPSLHDPLLDALGWQGFTDEELALVPPVVALEAADRLCRAGLRSLSALLRSGRPVKVLVEVDPAVDPDHDGPLGAGIRFEVGYFGISHREALVHQSTAARPVHLLDGFRRALCATRPSLHVLAATRKDEAQLRLGAWLHLGAALEGRAHPLFCYDPDGGPTWARRFDLGGNTSPEVAWPSSAPQWEALGLEGEVPFTFADFALLEVELASHFEQVPEEIAAEHLAPVASWLALPQEEASRKVPFVWAADEGGKLHKVALTRELAFACRDRQSFWRTLQEWAGVHNEHVERAVTKALEQAEAARTLELAQVEAEHAAALEQARRDTAAESMQKLAQMLLDTDFTAVSARQASASAAPATSSAPTAEAPSQAAVPAPQPAASAPAEELSFDDPFIDTPLCTSCNDCIAVNPVMFVYDGNKQARIGDLSAGSFEQLVRAAEKCPAKCIHPGKPKDPSEPNLEALIARAAPFN